MDPRADGQAVARDAGVLVHARKRPTPVRVVFQTNFRPHIVEDTRRETVAGHFRTAIVHRREESHILDRTLVCPTTSAMKAIANLFAKMHHGRLNDYVGYVLGFLILILVLFRIT